MTTIKNELDNVCLTSSKVKQSKMQKMLEVIICKYKKYKSKKYIFHQDKKGDKTSFIVKEDSVESTEEEIFYNTIETIDTSNYYNPFPLVEEELEIEEDEEELEIEIEEDEEVEDESEESEEITAEELIDIYDDDQSEKIVEHKEVNFLDMIQENKEKNKIDILDFLNLFDE